MLYDPKWGTKVKTANQNLVGFIAWLEKQPPAGEYKYTLSDRCALAQYLKSQGEKHFSLLSFQVAEWTGDENIVRDHPHTFGAALTRARAALL